MKTVQFRHIRYHMTDEYCLSVFDDGSYVMLDINRSHGAGYRGIAALFGYDDHVRYAKHHDLTHHWLGEMAYGGKSPVLHGEALGKPVGTPEPEEAAVNALQKAWAEGETDSSPIIAALGDDWRIRAAGLFALLESVE